MTSDKLKLIVGAKLENQQSFASMPTLGELQHFLMVISEELTVYKVWPVSMISRTSTVTPLMILPGELLVLLLAPTTTSWCI